MNSSLFGLPVGYTSAWIFNAYIIEGDAGLVVIDPGLPMVARQVLSLVADRRGELAAEIVGIACTHGHPDHVGGVSELSGATDAATHLPERCRSYLDGEKPRTFPLVASSLRFMSVLGEQSFSAQAARDLASLSRSVGFGGPEMMTLDFEPSGFLAGDAPLAGASDWQVISAPGHTDDSIVFYHGESATLISGDTVVTQDGGAWFNPEFVDLKDSHSTEERLRSLEVRHLLPGHGNPIDAPDVWATAKTATDKPTGGGVLARCSRRFAKW